jgi:hypothetical protein
MGQASGNVWVQGRLWGWAQKVAVLDGKYLNVYSKPEDIPVSFAELLS